MQDGGKNGSFGTECRVLQSKTIRRLPTGPVILSLALNEVSIRFYDVITSTKDRRAGEGNVVF